MIAKLPPASKEVLLSKLDTEEGFDDDDTEAIELVGDSNLCVFGTSLIAQPAPIMQNNEFSDRDEGMMDAILEEACLVFEGQGLNGHERYQIDNEIDRELRDLGLDGDCLDEYDEDLGQEQQGSPSVLW